MCGMILAPARYPSTMIESAMARMAYRGPDHTGIVKFGNWNMGHNRLAIQDLSERGNQPFRTDNNSMAMFVGEFFNTRHFAMPMDPDRAYEQVVLEWLLQDPERFHLVDGFWAAAEVMNDGIAHVYTDHLGIKPLYFWVEHNIVCSEIEPMFALEPRPALDEVYLGNCIKFGYDYGGRSPYQGIVQVYPGTMLTLGLGTYAFTPYWSYDKVPVSPGLDELQRLIEEAIRNRMICDRPDPVALLLSGGLDSSIIYYTIKKVLGRDIDAFSVENGESEYLPEGVQTLKVRDVSTKEAVKILQAPSDLGSMVPQVQLAEAVASARHHVCMTGDGADEVFGGYRRAAEYDSQQSDIFCELPFYHLPRLDRIMMKETIELRSPYLSPKVIAFGLQLPRAYRTSKEALKHAFKDIVPDEILWRKKHPLKTQAVIEGGQEYRIKLVEEFRQCQPA